jgi:NhaP-type Na+/H+ or K+/H+ antiporter
MGDIFTTIINDFNSKKYRVFSLSAYDFIGTLVIVFFIHLYMWNNPVDLTKKEFEERTSFMYIISLIFLSITAIGLGVFFHYIFNQKSQLSYNLGFSGKRNLPDIINLF